MKKISLFLFSLCLILSNFSNAQNPFESIGKKSKPMLTLSDGRYIEYFDNDSVRQIGSAMVNVYTEQIVAFVDRKEQAKKIHAQTSSRFLSVDPLAREYPYYTPYQYAGNTPIQAIDLDGLEPAFPQSNGTYTTARTGAMERPLSQQGQEFFQSKQPTEYHEGLLEGLITDISIDIAYGIGDPLSKAITGRSLDGDKVSGGDRVMAVIEVVQIAEGAKGGEGGVGGKPNVSPKLEKIHGNSVKSQKPSGNYTNEHASGKTYSGVGDIERMNKSGKRIANQHSDPVVGQEFNPAANKKAAYIKEHIDIEKNGGAGNKAENYNKINSPGKKLSEQSKAKED